MSQPCNCPTAFNIITGIFLMTLAIVSWMHAWGIHMPVWLSVLSFVWGLLMIVLNHLNRIHEDAENLSSEEATRLHAYDR